MYLIGGGLLVDGAHHGGYPWLGAPGDPSEQVGHEVGAARCQLALSESLRLHQRRASAVFTRTQSIPMISRLPSPSHHHAHFDLWDPTQRRPKASTTTSVPDRADTSYTLPQGQLHPLVDTPSILLRQSSLAATPWLQHREVAPFSGIRMTYQILQIALEETLEMTAKHKR